MHVQTLERIANTDGGLRKLIDAWERELESLRLSLESVALKEDRSAAVAAGRLDGFRRAVFGVVRSVYDEIVRDGGEVIPPPTYGSLETEEDDGY